MVDFSEVRKQSNYKAYRTDRDRVVRQDVLDAELEPIHDADADVAKVLAPFDRDKASWMIRKQVGALLEELDDAAKDTVISLLFDTRGGMRGWPIVMFSAVAGIMSKELDALGIKHEVLSHTTNEWKIPREQAMEMKKERESGMQDPVGRVSSLLHIIWKDVESKDDKLADKMLNLGQRSLLKENVDGEAVEWAYNRLAERTEPLKVLLTVRHGGIDPISDATLSYNGSNTSLLHQHLLDTVSAIKNEGLVNLSAVILERHQEPGFFDPRHQIDDDKVSQAYGEIHICNGNEWMDAIKTMTDAVCNSIRHSYEMRNSPKSPSI
jgi:hypothetical protein